MWTITANPSYATLSSKNEILLFLQSSASLSLIGLEALLIWVSFLANFLNPPPVPETPTVTLTFGWTALNSSATASVIGYTVLDPSILISPDNLESEDFYQITKQIVDLAYIHSKGRVISFLEGGYDLLALSESIKQHLLALKN